MAYSDLSYSKIGWKNRSEALTTPLGKTNLNKMDEMIYNLVIQLSEAYNELNLGKANSGDFIGNVVSGVDYDSTIGKFTFSFFGSQQKYVANLNLDKLPIDFSMSSDGVITMVTQGGDRYTADISQLIPTFDFQASDMIEFSVETTGKNSVVKAFLKQNSITDKYMQPNYLADITTQAGIATSQAELSQGYADDAAYDAKLAQSYAVGGSGVRDGEDTDNAKYYKEQAENIKSDISTSETNAKTYADNAKTYADNAKKSEQNAKESEQNALRSEGNAKQSEDNAKESEGNAKQSEDNAKESEGNAKQSEDNAKESEGNAKQSEDNAKESEGNAKQSEDNAKESEDTAKSYLDAVQGLVDGQQDILDEINKKLDMASFTVDDNGNLVYTDGSGYIFSVDDNGDLNWEVA